jgi:predicted nucleic acid-binding Zn ribbon protein
VLNAGINEAVTFPATNDEPKITRITRQGGAAMKRIFLRVGMVMFGTAAYAGIALAIASAG